MTSVITADYSDMSCNCFDQLGTYLVRLGTDWVKVLHSFPLGEPSLETKAARKSFGETWYYHVTDTRRRILVPKRIVLAFGRLLVGLSKSANPPQPAGS